MKDSRISTKLFNEWIYLTSEHEKTLTKIGKQIYQAFIVEQVEDLPSLEMCREVSQVFFEARETRKEAEEELKRKTVGEEPVIPGLEDGTPEKKADTRSKFQAQLAKASKHAQFGLQKQLFKFVINQNLAGFKDQVEALSRKLGERAVVMVDRPVLNDPKHLDLVKLAIRLEKESDAKWREIVDATEGRKGAGQSFHTSLMSFGMSFLNYARDSRLKPLVDKLTNYDYKAEREKLVKRFRETRSGNDDELQQLEEQKPEEMRTEDLVDQMQSLEQEYLTPVEVPEPEPEPVEPGEPDMTAEEPAAPEPPPRSPQPAPMSVPFQAQTAQTPPPAPSLIGGRRPQRPQSQPAVSPPKPPEPPTPPPGPPMTELPDLPQPTRPPISERRIGMNPLGRPPLEPPPLPEDLERELPPPPSDPLQNLKEPPARKERPPLSERRAQRGLPEPPPRKELPPPPGRGPS